MLLLQKYIYIYLCVSITMMCLVWWWMKSKYIKSYTHRRWENWTTPSVAQNAKGYNCKYRVFQRIEHGEVRPLRVSQHAKAPVTRRNNGFSFIACIMLNDPLVGWIWNRAQFIIIYRNKIFEWNGIMQKWKWRGRYVCVYFLLLLLFCFRWLPKIEFTCGLCCLNA